MSSSAAAARASSGPRFLGGTKIYLLGFSSQARNSAVNQIKNAGGEVANPIRKVPALFGSKSPPASSSSSSLPAGVTHVVCGMGDSYNYRSPSSILDELGLASPPPKEQGHVVTGAWLTVCLQQQKRVDEGPFEIDLTATPPPPPLPPAPAPATTEGKREAPIDGAGGSVSSSKRPRPSPAAFASDASSLPRPPPLLAGQDPQAVPGLSARIPTNHTWMTYPIGLLHLKVNGGHAPLLPPATGGEGKARIAAFDLDSTLVKTRSGKTFPTVPTDWQWQYPSVPSTLRDLHAQGFRLYLLSNQKGISTKGVKLTYPELTARVSAVVAALGLPDGARVEGFFATHDNIFYKPRPGMWFLLEDAYAHGERIDRPASFYAGDAAGRPNAAGWKKDHGDGDLKFAINAGLPFKTPEELFLGRTRQGSDPLFHSGEALRAAVLSKPGPLDGYLLASSATPSAAAASAAAAATKASSSSAVIPLTEEPPLRQQQEAVLLVGPPASGKSSYCAQHLPGHTRVNQDTLKTLDKCKQAAREALGRGESVVIDATNALPDLRQQWVQLLRQAHKASNNNSNSNSQLRVRAVEFLAPERCDAAIVHLNCFRGVNPHSHDPRMLPFPALKGVLTRLQRVGVDEGFDAVEQVAGLTPGPFRHQREHHLFFSLLTK